MRNRILLPLLAVIAGKAFVPNGRTGSAAAPIPDMDAVRRIVREYLLEHPEVIEEAIRVLQAKRESEEQDRARGWVGFMLAFLLFRVSFPFGFQIVSRQFSCGTSCSFGRGVQKHGVFSFQV